MVTNFCNLDCPYCFAKTFTKENITHISLENFKKIVSFILGSEKDQIGLIGGEPMLHPKINELLRYLINIGVGHRVLIFSNGIYIDKARELIEKNRIRVLVNYNDASIIQDKQVKKRLSENLHFLSSCQCMSLGINIFDKNQKFDDLFATLEEYHIKSLRISIAVPNKRVSIKSPLEYYWDLKETLIKVILKTNSLGIRPVLDCNIPPLCMITNEERRKIRDSFGEQPYTNALCIQSTCEPVIDIMPNMTAIRCFGASQKGIVDIEAFENIDQLRKYFTDTIDAKKTFPVSVCEKGCRYKKIEKCDGVCLGFYNYE